MMRHLTRRWRPFYKSHISSDMFPINLVGKLWIDFSMLSIIQIFKQFILSSKLTFVWTKQKSLLVVHSYSIYTKKKINNFSKVVWYFGSAINNSLSTMFLYLGHFFWTPSFHISPYLKSLCSWWFDLTLVDLPNFLKCCPFRVVNKINAHFRKTMLAYRNIHPKLDMVKLDMDFYLIKCIN